MTEINIEQGTKEWLQARLGKVTGTRMKDVLKADNLALIDELISEIECESSEESFQSKDMERGKEQEGLARVIYCQVHDVAINEVGFCLSDKYDFVALSPDGFTPCRKGAIEIKCPSTKTHIKYIRQGKLPSEYKPQVLTYFIVNEELEWLDFISFDDRFEAKQYFEVRVTREELAQDIEEAERSLVKFWAKFLKYYKQVIN